MLEKKTGQNIMEWALIVAFVSVLSMFTLFFMGDQLEIIGQRVIDSLQVTTP